MDPTEKHGFTRLCQLGAWSALLLLLYSLATISIVTLIGGPPVTVDECFRALHDNRVSGLLRLDILTVFAMPLYYVLFYALHQSLEPNKHPLNHLAAVLVFSGVTLFLAAPSVFSYLRLSDGYWSATTDTERAHFRSAAEAILAADIWNGTGSRISGLLVQSGALLFSFLMLQSKQFTRLTAITGILTHGLDLIHVLLSFITPLVANFSMGIAGVLYLAWFPLMAAGFFRLNRTERT